MAADRAMRDRLLAFERDLDRRVCEEVLEGDGWTLYLCPSLPQVWDMSWVAVERAGMSAAAVEALADELLGRAGFDHRTVVPCDEDEGRRLAVEFGARAGWEVERVQYMTWAPGPARCSSFRRDASGKDERRAREMAGLRGTTAVREAELAEILPLRRRLQRELLPAGVEDRDGVVEELLEMDRRYGEAGGDRWFAAPAEGEPASACRLLAGDGIRQVEDVATLASRRGQGLAQAVVLAALGAAREEDPEVIFLSADADDWPRLMYGRLGFEAVGQVHVLRRLPSGH